MNKEDRGLDFLIVPIIVIYMIVSIISWIHNKIGYVGIASIFFVFFYSVFLFVRHLKKEDQILFEKIVVDTLYDKPIPEVDSANMGFYRKRKQYERECFLRQVQLIRDGAWHALNSKKSETAISRRELFANSYENLSKEAALVSKGLWDQISDFVFNAEDKFHTDYYINISNGLMEKAEKLKTDKGKKKYWQEAREVLEQGVVAGKGNIAILENALNRIPNSANQSAQDVQ